MVNDENALERLKSEPMGVGQWIIVAILCRYIGAGWL